MSESNGRNRPRLHVVRPAGAVDRAALMDAVVACIGARPEGLPPSELVAAVADHLAVAAEDILDNDLDVAMGMLVVTRRIDELGGRLVSVASDDSVATG